MIEVLFVAVLAFAVIAVLALARHEGVARRLVSTMNELDRERQEHQRLQVSYDMAERLLAQRRVPLPFERPGARPPAPPGAFVQIHPDGPCSFCRRPLIAKPPGIPTGIHVCGRCLAPFHGDCLEANGHKCGTYGCEKASSDPPAEQILRLIERDRQERHERQLERLRQLRETLGLWEIREP